MQADARLHGGTPHGAANERKTAAGEFKPYAEALPDRVLAHLRLLESDCCGFAVDRLTHSLQAATRAFRDGRDDEYVICALLHDIGETLGSHRHSHIAASILKPFVSRENCMMVEKHGIFQTYYFCHRFGMDVELRNRFAGLSPYSTALEFCEKYDAPAFDPDYDSLPLDFFEPTLRRVMAHPKYTIYKTVSD